MSTSPPPTTKITTSTSPSQSPATTSTTTSTRGKLKKIRRTSQHSSERDEDELRGRSSPMLSPNGSARGNSGDKKSRDSTTDSDSTPKKLIRIRRVSSSSKRRRGSADLGPSLMTRVTATVVSPDAAVDSNTSNDDDNKTQLTMLANPRTQLLLSKSQQFRSTPNLMSALPSKPLSQSNHRATKVKKIIVRRKSRNSQNSSESDASSSSSFVPKARNLDRKLKQSPQKVPLVQSLQMEGSDESSNSAQGNGPTKSSKLKKSSTVGSNSQGSSSLSVSERISARRTALVDSTVAEQSPPLRRVQTEQPSKTRPLMKGLQVEKTPTIRKVRTRQRRTSGSQASVRRRGSLASEKSMKNMRNEQAKRRSSVSVFSMTEGGAGSESDESQYPPRIPQRRASFVPNHSRATRTPPRRQSSYEAASQDTMSSLLQRNVQLEKRFARYVEHSRVLREQFFAVQMLNVHQRALLTELSTALRSAEPQKAVAENAESWLARIELHAAPSLDAMLPPQLGNPRNLRLSGSTSLSSDSHASRAPRRATTPAQSHSTSSSDESDDRNASRRRSSNLGLAMSGLAVSSRSHSHSDRDPNSQSSHDAAGTVSSDDRRKIQASPSHAPSTDSENEPMSPRSGAMLLGVMGSSRVKPRSMIPMLPGLGGARGGTHARARKTHTLRSDSHDERLSTLLNEDIRFRSNSIGALQSADTSDTSSYGGAGASMSKKLHRLSSRRHFSRPYSDPGVNNGSASAAAPGTAPSSGSGGGGGGGGTSGAQLGDGKSSRLSRTNSTEPEDSDGVPTRTRTAAKAVLLRCDMTHIVDLGVDTVTLHESLGRGGAASVYRAAVDGFSIACKMYHAEQMTPAERAAAERDVRMMESLNHPNVLLTLGHKYTTTGRLLLFVELASGTLSDTLDVYRAASPATPPTMPSILRAVHQIALALAFLHGQPEAVAHRDVKTENVFTAFVAGGDAADLARLQLKLGDFDSARYMRPSGDESESESARSSGLWRLKRNRRAKRLSMNVGTPEFMAPEMVNSQLADGGSYTEKVDVWSLGMTMFELMTLKIPYREDGYSRFELPKKIAAGVHPQMPDFVEQDESLQPMMSLYSQMTTVEVEKRPSSKDCVKKIAKLIKKL